MGKKTLSGGTIHDIPDDLRQILTADDMATAAWEDITPLARNEWICWIESAKKNDTRQKRMTQARENLADGKRRPCCWPGCPHR